MSQDNVDGDPAAAPTQRRISVPEHVLVQTLPDGESVFLNLQSEQYFGLDATGTQMWTALADSTTLAEAQERLLDVFDVDPDTLREDLERLVERLVQRGLLAVDRR